MDEDAIRAEIATLKQQIAALRTFVGLSSASTSELLGELAVRLSEAPRYTSVLRASAELQKMTATLPPDVMQVRRLQPNDQLPS